MARILFVSKAVEPPWNDSSKNLVRDVASALTRHEAVVMRRPGTPALGTTIRADVYAGASRFAPGLADNARALARLVASREQLAHFFFAPNPKSGYAARGALAVRRLPSVHTVCSAPHERTDLGRALFADVNVVLSAHTREAMIARGVPAAKLAVVPPALDPPALRTEEARRDARVAFSLPNDAPVIVYPGDLEFGTGALTTVRAVAGLSKEVRLVIACRAKTQKAEEAERALRAEVERAGIADRTTFVGETRRIHDLLACADVVALPSDTLYAKMDYPLVLLEAMAMNRPVIVGARTPAVELAEREAALVTEVEPDALRAVLGRLLGELVHTRFSPARVAAAYEKLYDTLLA
jgi:glycosyltransferase involved in cell wall biosynthesis